MMRRTSARVAVPFVHALSIALRDDVRRHVGRQAEELFLAAVGRAGTP